MALPTILRPTAAFLSKYSPSFSLTNWVIGAGDVAVQLALGLAFELGLRDLDADDGGEAFADIVASEVFLTP